MRIRSTPRAPWPPMHLCVVRLLVSWHPSPSLSLATRIVVCLPHLIPPSHLLHRRSWPSPGSGLRAPHGRGVVGLGDMSGLGGLMDDMKRERLRDTNADQRFFSRIPSVWNPDVRQAGLPVGFVPASIFNAGHDAVPLHLLPLRQAD
ncbi:hypothetical protein BGZ61DRAFT_183502 [Ilyonectria robusta]|uniref:uncharacterized protein n=1 Tax=Ilyonectria robusta TaxID=1079257 RepID=UPI001E8D07AF|nr:uncharacterized protein BGZ61DRAFT_183502 [Ilyonectria robusta]KAH8729534.1 hypothetical protein BGZ61DRAFT_183502 [Ilyonectria robusta]